MKKLNLQIFADPVIPKNTITPEINYETEAYINVTPKAETPKWATLAALTKNISQSLNEVLYQAAYYADKGWGSTEVTGGQLTLTLTGDCKNGDAASDYILSEEVQYRFGDARKTYIKLQRDNKYIIWPVTLANITAAYGDAGQPNALTVTVHGNGRPQLGEITTGE